MTRVDQFDQPSAVDMRVNLGRRDVRVAEKRLENPQVRAAGQQMCRERVAEHVGADALRRNASVTGHLPNDLEEANAAEVRLPAWEQPQALGLHMLQPAVHRPLRARGDRDESLLRSLSTQDQERLALAQSIAGKSHQLARSEA